MNFDLDAFLLVRLQLPGMSGTRAPFYRRQRFYVILSVGWAAIFGACL